MTPGAIEELKSALSGRIWISLHDRPPGNAGGSRIAEPIQLPAGSFSVGRNGALNVRDIEIPATRSGRAAYVGRWTPAKAFVGAGRLAGPQDVVAGQTVRFPRGTLPMSAKVL